MDAAGSLPFLSMQDINKSFFGKRANDQVSLEVGRGEIHALLGENGAGKTTLMNILYGLYERDGGSIFFEGEEVRFRSPRDALARGIGMVHQHFALVPALSAAQNVALGLVGRGWRRLFPDNAAIARKVAALSEQYGLEVDAGARVGSISVGEQQRVEIIKLLYRRARLLILDEPTACLTPRESERLFAVLHQIRGEGRSVIIITHRIAEVLGHSDRVTVLRDGKNVASAATAEAGAEELSRLMIGRPLKAHAARAPSAAPAAAAGGDGLRLTGVSSAAGEGTPLREVTLHVPRGAIVGVAGVDGNGQKEMAEVILGLRRTERGSVTLDGQALDTLSVLERRRRGIGFVSDDRHSDSLILDMGCEDNALLKFHAEGLFLSRGFINRPRIREKTQALVADYAIKTPSLDTPVRYLSGGNQQKLVLARELDGSPALIVACQPTRGLDIGAAEAVRHLLYGHRDAGCAVLLISSDLDEVLEASDMVAVMSGGRLLRVFRREDVDLTALGLLMAGIVPAEDAAAPSAGGSAEAA